MSQQSGGVGAQYREVQVSGNCCVVTGQDVLRGIRVAVKVVVSRVAGRRSSLLM
jgi:hypothetical protein